MQTTMNLTNIKFSLGTDNTDISVCMVKWTDSPISSDGHPLHHGKELSEWVTMVRGESGPITMVTGEIVLVEEELVG